MAHHLLNSLRLKSLNLTTKGHSSDLLGRLHHNPPPLRMVIYEQPLHIYVFSLPAPQSCKNLVRCHAWLSVMCLTCHVQLLRTNCDCKKLTCQCISPSHLSGLSCLFHIHTFFHTRKVGCSPWTLCMYKVTC
jgi:hypothetical protein